MDGGHGKYDPITGKYVTTPSKMWKHAKGEVFHNQEEFYEGISNDIITEKIIKLMEVEGIPYIRLHHKWKDTPLKERYEKANYHHKHIQKGFGMSIHSNASQTHTARGWCVFTSKNQTKSDGLAEFLWERVNVLLKPYTIQMREQTYVDKDKDYEEDFAMVVKTDMPFILSENLFFDEVRDARLLINETVQDLIAQAHFEMILYAQKTLKL